jgi:hypothetical protein
MKSSKKIRIQTSLGELVSAIWEETEALFKSRKGERQLVVAYVLNDLLRQPLSWSWSGQVVPESGNVTRIRIIF